MSTLPTEEYFTEPYIMEDDECYLVIDMVMPIS